MVESPPLARERERTRRRVIAIAVLLVLVVVSMAAIDKILDGQSAFVRWRPQVLDLPRGVNVYEPGRYPGIAVYPNTPLTGLLLWPLARLPAAAGATTFFLLKIAMVAASVCLAIRLAAGRRGPLSSTAIGLVILLAARPIVSDLQHGNINILVLFLVMGGLAAFAGSRTFSAGLILGLATVVKVTPGLFGAYFLYKRQWMAALGMIAGGLIGVAAPIPVLGFQHNVDMHIAWFDAMIRPYALDGTVEYTEHINQSLPGVFYRFFTDSPGVDQGDELGKAHINIASIPRSRARRILAVLMLATLAWLAFVCRTPIGDRRDWRLACEFSLVLIVMLLLSERSWKHHYVTMVLPFAVMVAHLWLDDPPTRLRRTLIGVIVFALAMMLLMSGEVIGWVYRGVAHKFIEGLGSYFWFAIASLVAISMVLRRQNRLRSQETARAAPSTH